MQSGAFDDAVRRFASEAGTRTLDAVTLTSRSPRPRWPRCIAQVNDKVLADTDMATRVQSGCGAVPARLLAPPRRCASSMPLQLSRTPPRRHLVGARATLTDRHVDRHVFVYIPLSPPPGGERCALGRFLSSACEAMPSTLHASSSWRAKGHHVSLTPNGHTDLPESHDAAALAVRSLRCVR